MARGSATMSLAPSRKRRFILEAKTGWPSVGLAPITMMTFGLRDGVKCLCAGRSPKTWS